MVNSWRKSHVTQTKPRLAFTQSPLCPTPVPRLSHTCPTLASSAIICPHERELLDEPQDTRL